MSKLYWRTSIELEPSETDISHRGHIVLLGSCFAENIGIKLGDHGFSTTINPTGILYNPAALQNMLEILDDPTKLDENRFVERQNHIFHYDFHSQFYAKTQDEFVQKLHQLSHNFIAKPSCLILTLGTAWIYDYEYKPTANCHKQPKSTFVKRLLSINEITASLQQIRQLIDPSTRLILTVSPVRHVKDGIMENQQSKAHLISGVHRYLADNPQDEYFPSYEIMIDDLRDYRYYSKDLLHPSEQAIEYIWERFGQRYFNEKTQQINREISSLHNMEKHRSFFPDSDEHKAFLEKLHTRKEQLLVDHPYLDL